MKWEVEEERDARCPRCGVQKVLDGKTYRAEGRVTGIEVESEVTPGLFRSVGPLRALVCRRCGCVDLSVTDRGDF